MPECADFRVILSCNSKQQHGVDEECLMIWGRFGVFKLRLLKCTVLPYFPSDGELKITEAMEAML